MNKKCETLCITYYFVCKWSSTPLKFLLLDTNKMLGTSQLCSSAVLPDRRAKIIIIGQFIMSASLATGYAFLQFYPTRRWID